MGKKLVIQKVINLSQKKKNLFISLQWFEDLIKCFKGIEFDLHQHLFFLFPERESVH